MSEKERVNKVVKREETGVATVTTDATMIANLVKRGKDYLPRLQLQTANSKDCKSGGFPVNHWAIVQDQSLTDLGSTVDVFVIGARMQALDFSDDSNVISIHDPELDKDDKFGGMFAEIVNRSKEKDSKCMWGSQFLIYVPMKKMFATVLFGTITSRNDAPDMLKKIGGPCTLGSKKIPNKKYGDYYSMAVLNCSESLEGPGEEELAKEVEKFKNPPKKVMEKVEVAKDQQAR